MERLPPSSSGGDDALVFPDCRCSFVGHDGSCRVRTIGELLAMPLAHGAEVSSKVLKRIIGASK
jgi:hypothetical protein